jgi:CRISPR-associated protein cas5
MTEALYIRLAGPLQSWAGPAITGNFVRTEPRPTRSGLVGLLAGACGYGRGEYPEWLTQLHFQIREDNRGTLVDDFHTINPCNIEKPPRKYKKRKPEIAWWNPDDVVTSGVERQFRSRLLLSTGKPIEDITYNSINHTPNNEGFTAVVKRTYIADGEFIVQIKAGSREHQELLAEKLQQPHFVTYLGRKAFAPSFPFYLGVGPDDIFARIPTVGGEEPKKILRFYALDGDRRPPTEVPVVKDRKQWLIEVSKIFRSM